MFPVIPKSKAPAVANGFLAASTDLAVINAWWEKRDCSIGVSVPEGIIVVDFDALAHEHILATEGMNVPDTIVASTPGKGGGRHYWYRLPAGVSVSPKVKAIEGIDIRTKGSYVLVAPSPHPEGGHYAWLDMDGIPTAEQIASLPICPQWILNACETAAPEGEREKVDLLSMMRGVDEGERQLALFRAASYLCSKDFDKELTLVILEGIAKASEGSGYKKWPDLKALVNRVWRRYHKPLSNGAVDSKRGWTLDELVSADLGGINWYVDSLLAPGLGIIVADSGAGKSMCIADLSLSIATRERAWGKFTVPRARGVLYLDLEQNPLSGQDRWKKMLGDRVPPQNIHVHFEWPRMDDGGLDKIVLELQKNPDIQMVVIDILSLFWPTVQPGANAYHAEYGVLGKLRKVANEYGVLFLLIHHTNKAGDFSGSSAMKGALDYKFELSREQGASTGLMKVWGKNIEARQLIMEVDFDTFRWRVSGQAS